MISAGRLRHTATVLRASSSSVLGEPTVYASVGSPFRCDFRESAAAQSVQAGGAVTVKSSEIRTRWSTWLDRDVRVTDRLSVAVNGTTRIVSVESFLNLNQANRVAVATVLEVEQ